MRKTVVPALVLLALSSAPAFAQDAADQDTRRAAEAADQEDRGEWGWLGLLGLAGLLGLKRRDLGDRVGRTRDTATGVR